MENETPRHTSIIVPYVRRRRRLSVVPLTPDPAPVSAAELDSPLSVPRGWGVQEVPRRNGSHTDRYYYEPGTGRKFRSIKAVHRYLKGEEYPSGSSTRKLSLCHRSSEYARKSLSVQKLLSLPRPRRMAVSDGKNSGHERKSLSVHKLSPQSARRMVVSGGKLLNLEDELSYSDDEATRSAPSVLPDGWIVEEVPRKHSTWADRYYYEPGTGVKFRSLAAVERHLAELDDDNVPLSKALEEIKENKPLSKIFKLENRSTKNSIPSKKNAFGERRQGSSDGGLPSKVSWIIADPQGDTWNPFIYEALVTGAVKQEWRNRFMLLMNDEESTFPST